MSCLSVCIQASDPRTTAGVAVLIDVNARSNVSGMNQWNYVYSALVRWNDGKMAGERQTRRLQ